MSDLYRALGDIRGIRRQIAQSTQFRGYGPATLAATGVIAIAAAYLQARWVPEPMEDMLLYLHIWMVTAVLSAAMVGVQMYTRSRRMHSGLSDEMIRMAAEQFAPALLAGLLVGMTLARYAAGALWVLPGMLQVIYSLGIFSSCRFLPRPMLAAGGWYMVTGLVCLSLHGERALAPWTMGLAYGAGQMLIAAILLVASPEGSDEE